MTTLFSYFFKNSFSLFSKKLLIFLALLFILLSCNKSLKEPSIFTTLGPNETGIDFSNELVPRPDFNMFKYMYFYNGAGVAAGDYNNDGLVDLFFTSNQGQNKLYINKGQLRFEDVTTAAKIPVDSSWSNGASVVDINADGLLDIYISKVGNYGSLQSKNQFLICKGLDKNKIPYYEDEAKELGLDKSTFGTQAAFFDYDLDGDLDAFLMNHSLRYNGTFNERKSFENSYDSLSADFLFNNDNGKFVDVSKQAGIIQSVIGYGLGLCVADVNMDGWPDMYIGNDFQENDYLYINQKNGTFKETLTQSMMHTSQFTMGVDIADLNNDALPEIVSLDMQPADPKILRRSMGDDEYNLYNFKIRAGYHPQSARNALQLNRGNGYFSDVAMYAGVEATDWSWAALFTDFNNDGNKDLFISNGIPKRMNDMDYIAFLSNDQIQEKIRNDKVDEKDMALVNKFPEIKLENNFFMNGGSMKFKNIGTQILNQKKSFSNGAAYADFDNDGDIDLVVNNINDPVFLYENTSARSADNKWLSINWDGGKLNKNAIGAKVLVFAGTEIRSYEQFPVRGFQSSMQVPTHVGLGNIRIDSILAIWPDAGFEKLAFNGDSVITLKQSATLPKFNYKSLKKYLLPATKPVEDIAAATGITYKHEENPFNEFDREQLMPHMVSREGPAVAVADINGDKLEDFYIGSAKFNRSNIFLQQANGKFVAHNVQDIINDSSYEDVDAVFVDVNKDQVLDLLIASGGNEFSGESEMQLPRVYINDGKANFKRKLDAFDKTTLITASCIKPFDFTGDGHVDLFIGGRVLPWNYGQAASSFLLKNDGTGKFTDVTQALAPALKGIGLVTDAAWADFDKDGKQDFVISKEWGGIVAFKNQDGKFKPQQLCKEQGWWNCLTAIDVDADGDLDLIAGNLGNNNRLRATIEEPVSMYLNDFDDNGTKEQVLSYFVNKMEIPFSNKDEIMRQIPSLKKKFLYAADFASASLSDVFTASKLKAAQKFTANYFSNSILINNGNWNFTITPMPWQAQLSCVKDAITIDANEDALPDILLAGNFYPSNIQMGRYDADYGSILVNRGMGRFEYSSLNGFQNKGETRKIAAIEIKGKQAYLMVKNNDSLAVIRFK